jgi:hypothetical protein
MKNDTTDLSDTTALSQNGAARPTLLSSTATLFWRLFVPVFSTVILASFSFIFWLMDEESLYLSVPLLWVRIGLVVALVAWVWLMARTLWRLRRVDVDAAHVFVTDYWTTVRYPWVDVAGFSESRRLGRRIAHLHLKAPGRFGQKISFLPTSTYQTWLAEHEQVAG